MKMPFNEKLAYIGACIASFGFWWLVKIVIKKAIIEANQK